MPQVSVVVPLFNKSRYIARALTSILGQSFTDFEIIVIDDGSTDDGPEIVARIHDVRLRLIRQNNAGPGAARNVGIENSTGTFLTFLDADDEWMPSYLDQGVSSLRDTDPLIAAHTCAYFDEPKGFDSSGMWRARGLNAGIYTLTPDAPPISLVHRVAFMSPCTTMVRAATAREFGGFYTREKCRYAEDAHLWLRVLLQRRVSISLEPHVRIHRNASDLSATTRVVRQLEPFLADPDSIRHECPPALQPLLDQFLAIRAFKTACAWGYWGEWRRARELIHRFSALAPGPLPYYFLARCAATPVAGLVGKMLRSAGRTLTNLGHRT